MRINHNIAALNTYSRLSAATAGQARSLEKLSSGQRVNRAGDDAAGLAISEKMRAQIRGLNQASRNSQDGISMIQTAEGALSETHSILQRMRELAVQAANSTYTDADRQEIQKEVNQLSSEVNRIAGTTEFNKQALLDGGQAAGSVKGATAIVKKAGTDATQGSLVYEFTCDFNLACDITVAGCTITANAGGCLLNAYVTCSSVSGSVSQLANLINMSSSGALEAVADGNKLTIRAVAGSTLDGKVDISCGINIDGGLCTIETCWTKVYTEGQSACAQEQRLTFSNESIKEGVKISVGNCTLAFWNSGAGTYATAAEAKAVMGVDAVYDIYNGVNGVTCAKTVVSDLASCTTIIGGGATVLCIIDDTTLKITTGTAGSIAAQETKLTLNATSGSAASEANGMQLQIGANTGQSFTLTFGDMTGKALNIVSEAAGNTVIASNGKIAYYNTEAAVDNNGEGTQYSLDLSTAARAASAISVIEDSIASVSAERSKMGAYQNRLEHTIANLDTSAENLTAAESRIRDVDMAKEMMEFTKNNILNQAATAMLAQANQQPQGVLQLLR